MRGTSTSTIRTMLDVLYWSGLYHVMAPKTAGLGMIFMLHRVRQAPPAGSFQPNAMLEVTPEFLDATLSLVKARGLDIVDLDEAARRIRSGRQRRFAVFTFDDGYADNLDVALPIFQAHDAPFTIYVTTGLMDGTADIWWLMLEEAIRRSHLIRTRIGGQGFDLPTASPEEKQVAWDAIYWPLRDLSIDGRHEVVSRLAEDANVDERRMFDALSPGWARMKAAASHKLVRIGAHTLTHPPLAALTDKEARHEIVEGKRRLEAEIGRPVDHFAYPFGDHGSAGLREFVGSSRVDLQACKLEYSIVSPK